MHIVMVASYFSSFMGKNVSNTVDDVVKNKKRTKSYTKFVKAFQYLCVL